jgi:hypothetical protein
MEEAAVHLYLKRGLVALELYQKARNYLKMLRIASMVWKKL